MNKRIIGTFFVILLIFTLLLSSQGGILNVRAVSGDPPGPDRFAPLLIDITLYQWWMTEWASNNLACQILIEHAGSPTHQEIFTACGEQLYNTWLKQQPCDQKTVNKNPEQCSGYYLHFINQISVQKEIGVMLPAPQVWLSLPDCSSTSFPTICLHAPVLQLGGDEPLPNERITRIAGTLDGKPFECVGNICDLPLTPTPETGMPVTFWAYSSYGDSSRVFDALIRVGKKTGIASDVTSAVWHVDVISTQWAGPAIPSCAGSWQTFPPTTGLPNWLRTPEQSSLLASNIPYEYLAANLISRGVVDVHQCPDQGFTVIGEVSRCGLDAALPAVTSWQNRFDRLIYTESKATGIPAQTLKNLFSRESQFWPGIFPGIPEVGLGQLTNNGADTTLLWNPSFYEQFCPLVLDAAHCQRGYLNLDTKEQELLRAALVNSVDAFCPDCPLGIDIYEAEASVRIFAHTLLANCEQTGRIVRNVTRQAPGQVSTYEELWKMTLTNYNAGSGCLSKAVARAYRPGVPLLWSAVAAELDEACSNAIDYVEDISSFP